MWLALKQQAQKLWNDEEGIGTLEVVLIIAVVVIIFIVFKDFIIQMVNKYINKAEDNLETNFKKPTELPDA